MPQKRLITLSLAVGDLFFLYAALAFTLLARYGIDLAEPWKIHKFPFLAVFGIWILLFFIAGLYEQNVWSADRTVKERILRTIAAAGLLAVLLFYLVPAFVITPKTNLLIVIALSMGLLIGWRMLASAIIRNTSKTNILFFGVSDEVIALSRTLNNHPHLGYRVAALVHAEPSPSKNLPPSGIPILPFDAELPRLLQHENISLVVASAEVHSNKEFVRMLYNVLPLKIRFMDFPTFYEQMTGKVPVSLISEIWFLENVSEREKRVFEVIKRSYDAFVALLLCLPVLIMTPFIVLAIKLDSRGPVFIRQKRIGKNDIPFTIYKFRSMIASTPDGLAEDGKARWAEQGDGRITRAGRFLRNSRLDELPQLINILKGEMSFVGPRPERPEFIETLKAQIPFYEIRHLVRPGLSGWAQINFPYGASVEDAMQKLQLDLYYIKNRSVALDLNIALKTIWVILSREGR